MIELGLQRISRLLANVPLSWRAIHVAGTNGKGSICTYVSEMLEAYNNSEYRDKHNQSKISHGRFMSPHLIDRWDCISINQKTISKNSFDALQRDVLAKNEAQAIGASEFEILTASAFKAFTDYKLDVGVVEVGMGGRLDATNVIGQPEEGRESKGFRPPPLVTAISRIGMDHQAFLGDTIEAIAAEKAGIIKPGVPVVYDGDNQAEVRDVIEEAARRNRSSVSWWDEIRSTGLKLPWGYLPGNESEYEDFPTWITQASRERFRFSKDGAHVKANTSVAFRASWTALQGMNRIPLPLPSEDKVLERLMNDMLFAPARARIPGRQESVDIQALTGTKRTILLDGAHNSQAIEVLAHAVEEIRFGSLGTITWVLAATDSKEITDIIRPLVKAQDQVFAVEFGPVDGMPWIKPMSSRRILEAVYDLVPGINRRNCHDCGKDVLGAIQAASRKSYHKLGRRMVVAGSLYLVGDVHRLLRDATHQDEV